MKPPELPTIKTYFMDRFPTWACVVMTTACGLLAWLAYAISTAPNIHNTVLVGGSLVVFLFTLPLTILLIFLTLGRLIFAALDATPKKFWERLSRAVGYVILTTIVLAIVGAIIFAALTFIDRKLLLILAIAVAAYLVIRSAVAAGIRDAQGR